MTTQRFLSGLDADILELEALEQEARMVKSGDTGLNPMQQMRFANVVSRWAVIVADLNSVDVAKGDVMIQISMARSFLQTWRRNVGDSLILNTMKALIGTGGAFSTGQETTRALDVAAGNYDPDLSAAGRDAQKLWTQVMASFPRLGAAIAFPSAGGSEAYYDKVMQSLAIFQRHYGPKSRVIPLPRPLDNPNQYGLFAYTGTATYDHRGSNSSSCIGAGTWTLTALAKMFLTFTTNKPFSVRGTNYPLVNVGGLDLAQASLVLRPGDQIIGTANLAVNDLLYFSGTIAHLPLGCVLLDSAGLVLPALSDVESMVGLYDGKPTVDITECLAVAERYARYLRESGAGDVTKWMARVFASIRANSVGDNPIALDDNAQLNTFLAQLHVGNEYQGVPLSDLSCFFDVSTWIDNSNLYNGVTGYYSISTKRILYRNWYVLVSFLVTLAASDGRFAEWDVQRN